MNQITRPVEQDQTSHQYINRRVIPIVVLAFVIMGVITLLVMRDNTYTTLSEKHDIVLSSLVQQVAEDVGDTVEDIRNAGSSTTIRQFAEVAGGGAVNSQANTALAALFLDTIQSNIDSYAAVRYIDAAGQPRLEVINDMRTPVINEIQGQPAFIGDADFNAALDGDSQQVFMSMLFSQPEGDGVSPAEPVTLYRFSMPVRLRESVVAPLGVLQLDVYANALLGAVNAAPQLDAYALPERRFIIQDREGQYLADTAAITAELNTLRPTIDLDALLQQGTRSRIQEGSGLIVSTERLDLPVDSANMPWKLAVVDNAAIALADFNTLALTVLFGAVVVGMGVALVISRLIAELFAPLDRARIIARRITEENVEPMAVTASSGDDFLGAIHHMSEQLKGLSQSMHSQRRRLSRNLEIAARVSRESAMLEDLDHLLQRVLELICNEYGFYHAQIFLLDDVGQNALLAYSHGEAGQRMLERKHRLPVGSVSVVGGVTARGEAVVIDDTAKEGAEHAFNPLLPHTRAEMGLPLQVGGAVIGALDIQSVNPNAFNDDDVRVLQLLADQLALAIYNGRLLVQSNDRIVQIDQLNQQLTSNAWERAQDNLGLEQAYHYNLREVKEGKGETSPSTPNAAVSVPIRIRGQVVGAMDIAMPEGEELSAVDNALLGAITDRLSLVLENARLFQETQLTLKETSVLYEISSRINEVDSLNAVIKVIIDIVMPDAIGGQIMEFNERPYGVIPERLVVTADWSERARNWSHEEIIGLRLELKDYPFLAALQEDTVALVSDVETDTRLNESLKNVLRSMDAEAVAIIPLNMRGLWRAVLMVEFEQPRRFSDQEIRIYTALADQAGTAVDNRLLLQQTEQTLELRERMYAAGRAINAADNFADLVMAMLVTAGDMDLNFTLSLLEGPAREDGWPQMERIVARTVMGEVEEADELRPLNLLPESMLYQHEPEIVTSADLDDLGLTAQVADLTEKGLGFRAIFPLLNENQPIGLFYVTHPRPIRMGFEDFEYYMALTGQISTVLQKRRLLERTEQALEEARLLYAASHAITTSMDLNAIYRSAIEYVVRASDDINHIAVILAEREAPQATYAYNWVEGQRDSRTGEVVPVEQVPYLSLVQEPASSPNLSNPADNPQWQSILPDVGSLTIAPLRFRRQWFGVLVVESPRQNVFDERLNRFIQAVADQIAISLENSRLLMSVESERQLLSSILETMPSGVLVLDPHTLIPTQANEHATQLLGGLVSMDEPFTAERYHIYRSGTSLPYPDEELPIYNLIAVSGFSGPVFADDLVIREDDSPYSQLDLLMNAAPLVDADGRVSAIVAVIEDISSLRGLESALQDNLRETVTLYEASRSLSAAEEISDIAAALVAQFATAESAEVAVLLRNENTGAYDVTQTLYGPVTEFVLPQGILTDNEALFVSDVSGLDDVALSTELMEIGVMAFVALPLQVRSRAVPMGWVILTYSEPQGFTSDDQRFYTTLIESASTVLDNRYLFQSTEQALQEASILYNASRALTEANTQQEILQVAAEQVNLHPFTRAFTVLLTSGQWRDNKAIVEVAASWRNDGTTHLTGKAWTPAQFPAWRLLSLIRPLLIGDVHTAGDLSEEERTAIESLGFRSLVILPLRSGNRVSGSVWLGTDVETSLTFTPRDLRVYGSFAEQVSLTMQAAQLLEQTERRARQLSTSAEVSQIVSSILDLDILLPRLVDLIRETFRYDHVQVFLMDREDEYAVLRASTGEAGQQLLRAGHKLAKGSASVIGAVTAERRPVLALDTGNTDVVHRPNPYLPHTRSEMALPLVVKGAIVGALDVQSNEPNAFTEEDLAVLSTLANQIAVAIDNARLFEQAEHRANDMSLLFAVTTAAASAENLEEALQLVTEDLLDSMDARAVAIYLPITYVDELTDESYHYLRMTAAAGVGHALNRFPELKVGDPSNTVSIVASNFRSTVISRVKAEALYQPLARDSQSALVVPLVSGAHLVGVIVVESEQAYAYGHDSLTLLQTMGGSLSAIIQNAQLLARLQQTNDQLLELDRIKSEFLANMSHELRTPLNSIIGFSRVILKGIDGPLTEMQEQDLTTIYNSGQHLLGLINDILDQAKIAAGKMDLKPDYFDLKAVVEGVRSIGIGLVKEKPVSIKINIESGLPQVYGDEFRTRQVLINLVSNAAKFTVEGAITLSAYRYWDEKIQREMVRVDVADTGIGIAQKDIEVLFEAFRQVDSSLTRIAGGTGLGLPISKSLVELQGGELTMSSKVNVGSTFSLTIPLEPVKVRLPDQQSEDTDQAATLELKQVRPGVDFDDDDTLRLKKSDVIKAVRKNGNGNGIPTVLPPKRQLLIIEDNPDRVDQYRRILQREGFDVFTASIPLEAEAMASGLRPAVIIMDVNFANGKGWEILTRIKDRDDTFDIPVLVITLSADSEKAYQSGAYNFLQHPIMPDQLVEAVRAAEKESNTERILIIDDQPESARLLMQVLDTQGKYRVFCAQNGVEGVSMIARRRPDLVILDLRMPEMDGFAVLEELRGNPETANIPVLVVTGEMLTPAEQDLLNNVSLLYKSDISLEDYQRFIADVESQLLRNGE